MKKSNSLLTLGISLALTVANLSGSDIHTAVRGGDLEAVKALIADDTSLVNEREGRNFTPLHRAINIADSEIARYLIENGADLEARDDDGDTPLHWSAYYNRVVHGELLIASGASVSARNSLDYTPLRAAVASGNSEMVSILLAAGSPMIFEKYDDISMIQAVNIGLAELVEYRLKLGTIDTNLRGPEGVSLLHLAARTNNRSLIELFLDNGIPVDTRDEFGYTALHYTALFGGTPIVERLLAAGADIDAPDLYGRTARQLAGESGRGDIESLLLDRGANAAEVALDMEGDYLGMTTPGLEPLLFAPGIVSTPDRVEFSGTFTPDNNEFYFTRRSDPTDQRIWYSHRQDDGLWSWPDRAPFTYDTFEFEPDFTGDGKKVFYGSRRPLPGDSTGNISTNIWVAEKTDYGWSEPEYVGPDMMYVSIATDGTMYVTRMAQPGAELPTGIARRALLPDGTFGPFEMLSDSINYLDNFAHPEISPDGSYLIIDGYEPNAQPRGTDLFVSFRQGDGSWSRAIKLPAPVNQPERGELCARITADGKYLLYSAFNRTMSSSYANIYWVSTEVIEGLRPEMPGKKGLLSKLLQLFKK